MKNSIVKSVFVLLIAAFAVASASAQEKAAAPKFHELSNAEFDQLLAKPETLLIIDLRRPDELTNIGGFPVYLSIQSAELEKNLAWIPKERTIVTVSNHSTRSGKAAEFLTDRGFKVAGTVGAQTYEERGGKLTKIAPRQPRNVAAAVPAAK